MCVRFAFVVSARLLEKLRAGARAVGVGVAGGVHGGTLASGSCGRELGRGPGLLSVNVVCCGFGGIM